jgi:putative ABC transport system permease protein
MLYESEKRMQLLLKYFTFVAIIIACLGLYGLSAFTATRKTREIGIRKVLGAGTASVIYNLSFEFMILVFISMLIAFPAGWYFIGKMLQNFAYHINLNALIFVAIGAVSIVVAFATVCFQAYRAAVVNPAVALKAE